MEYYRAECEISYIIWDDTVERLEANMTLKDYYQVGWCNAIRHINTQNQELEEHF